MGVVGRLYVVLESDRGLVLLDQHAAHERVLFEQMLRRLEQAGTAPVPAIAPARNRRTARARRAVPAPATPHPHPPGRRAGLFDRALVNPIPVTLCRALGAEVVIAVNLVSDTTFRRTVIHESFVDRTHARKL